MQNSPAALIQMVAEANGIDLQNTTDAGEFSAYVLTLRQVEAILSNDLVNFSVDSLTLIKEAIADIRNSCNSLLKGNIDISIRENIIHIRQPLRDALAQIDKAAFNYGQTMRDLHEHQATYDIYQGALLSCGDIIVDINILLGGWKIVE